MAFASVALTALVAHLGLAGAPAVCMAGVALGDAWQIGDIDLQFVWQAWHLATATFTLRGRRGPWRHGRRGTYGTGLALVVLGSGGRRGCLRGRRGTW